MWKNVYPVYGAGIQTHNLLITSLLPQPQDQGSRPTIENVKSMQELKVFSSLKVCVKMKNLENGTEFIWPKEKFLNRLYLMKEMYNNYEEEEEDWDLPEVRHFLGLAIRTWFCLNSLTFG